MNTNQRITFSIEIEGKSKCYVYKLPIKILLNVTSRKERIKRQNRLWTDGIRTHDLWNWSPLALPTELQGQTGSRYFIAIQLALDFYHKSYASNFPGILLLDRLPVTRRFEKWVFFFLWPQITNWAPRRMRSHCSLLKPAEWTLIERLLIYSTNRIPSLIIRKKKHHWNSLLVGLDIEF